LCQSPRILAPLAPLDSKRAGIRLLQIDSTKGLPALGEAVKSFGPGGSEMIHRGALAIAANLMIAALFFTAAAPCRAQQKLSTKWEVLANDIGREERGLHICR
jgi:hypothetical protein